MAKWSIEVKKLNFDAFRWTATSDDGDFRQSNRWHGGTFDTETATLNDAIAEIQLYEVNKTRRRAIDSTYFELVTNG